MDRALAAVLGVQHRRVGRIRGYPEREIAVSEPPWCLGDGADEGRADFEDLQSGRVVDAHERVRGTGCRRRLRARICRAHAAPGCSSQDDRKRTSDNYVPTEIQADGGSASLTWFAVPPCFLDATGGNPK